MADRRIDQLTEAEDISDEDLFVIWKENISQTRSIKKGTMNLATKDYVDEVKEWLNITSDFSITGSTSGLVLNSVKYNHVLQQLKILVKKTNSTPAMSSIKLYLQYNGSEESIAFGANTILLWNHTAGANGHLVGMEYGSAVISSNRFQIDTYNRNEGQIWDANDVFRGVIWL